MTIPFRPFQHLVTVAEQKACLNCIRRHLAPGGRLVFDVFNPRLQRLYDPKYQTEIEDMAETLLPDGRRLRRANRTAAFNRDQQYNDVEIIYYITYPDGRTDRVVQSFPMRHFFRYEVEHLLELCGLRVVDLLGDFDGSSFDGDSPEMMRAVDKMIIVVEPGKGSIETAYRIRELAKDIGLKNVAVVANKIRSEQDRSFINSAMPDFEFLGFIPYDQSIIEAGLGNFPLGNSSPEVISRVQDIAAHLGAVKPELIGRPMS